MLGEAGNSGKGYPRTLSDSHLQQINLLRVMAGEAASLPEETAPQATSIVDLGTMDVLTMDITEMVELSGIEDGKEVQRYLFILEGQKLVAPYPRGDFTSSKWQITEQGIRALRLIDETGVQPQGAAA